MASPKYEAIKTQTLAFYESQKPIFCPALNDHVLFTSIGFNHIMYKRHRAMRDQESQIMRFKMLPRAIRLIELTTTYQEFEKSEKLFEVKMQKKKVMQRKDVSYWGIIAIIDERKIKVVVRKIGNGKIHFWSIIPAWVTNIKRDQKYIITMKDNPDED